MLVHPGLSSFLVCGTFSTNNRTNLGKQGWLLMLVNDGREEFQDTALIPLALASQILQDSFLMLNSHVPQKLTSWS